MTPAAGWSLGGMMKRSLGIGYAGVANPLMFQENTLMLLGDAKGNLDSIRTALDGAEECVPW